MVPAWLFDEFKMVGVDFEDLAQVEAYDRNQTISTPEKEQALQPCRSGGWASLVRTQRLLAAAQQER